MDDIRTRGWVSIIANAYRRKCDVYNRGFSGYNTRWAHGVADHVFPVSPCYLFTTIFFGANDAVHMDKNVRQGVPLDEYENNLCSLITKAAGCSKCVVVIAPPPVLNDLWPDRTLARTREYADAAARSVERTRATLSIPVVFIDLYKSVMDTLNDEWPSALRDGLHLSSQGNELLASAVLASIPAGLRPDDLPVDFPIHRNIDVTTSDSWQRSFTQTALEELHSAPVSV